MRCRIPIVSPISRRRRFSLDEARDIIHALKIKFPNIVGPHSQDICYATENRQVAVRNVAHNADLVLVVGSTNSSNSNRLVEVSRNLGTVGYLIDNSQAIDPEWLEGVVNRRCNCRCFGSRVLVEDVVNYLNQNGFSETSKKWKSCPRMFGLACRLKLFRPLAMQMERSQFLYVSRWLLAAFSGGGAGRIHEL